MRTGMLGLALALLALRWLPVFADDSFDLVPCATNAEGSACVNNNTRYLEVPGANQRPRLLKEAPAPLREKLPMQIVTYHQIEEQAQGRKYKKAGRHHHRKVHVKRHHPSPAGG